MARLLLGSVNGADGLQLAGSGQDAKLVCAFRAGVRRLALESAQGVHHVVELHRLGARRGHPLEPERRLGGANPGQPPRKDRAFLAYAEIRMGEDVEWAGERRFGGQEGFELAQSSPGMTSTRAWRPA